MFGAPHLDELLPVWHWRSRSTAWMDAPAAEVFLAFEQVNLSELPGAAAIRQRQSKRDRSAVTMLHDLLDQGFFLLHEEPERELVLGRIGQFWRPGGPATVQVAGRRAFLEFAEPGYAKAAFSLQVLELDRGSMAAVESRVLATDEHTHREFNRYWLVDSWANPAGRQQLLHAVRERATNPARWG
ncbi:MAG: hypothetical protein AB7W59_18915 [Acidimicrobiia bacterium]